MPQESTGCAQSPPCPPLRSKVWLKVWKVISKMLEENEKFRHRLLTCSQFNGEGNDMNQSSQKEALSLDREESIFGWV
ncbi:uncharacterized protein C5orf47 homolog isoform X4 [Numida meleagris]|uniref:uncharacterized protein C5orf47 homolog isoform X4 n=1 Tax=Numida meleagris TaxID=8996 RepID=UPI000B3D9FDE|nr:uncharacterized protein C5orf47 homolog isoform X4 [Numida meleagris]